ncbi:MAG: universal stress protein [Candidatus Dormibacteraceae bacterium]
MLVVSNQSEKRRSVFPELGARPRVLVPVLKGQLARPIASIGDALLAFPGASGNLLALVEVDANLSSRLATQDERRRDMLRWVAGLDYEGLQRRRMKVTLRVTADVVSTIRDVVSDSQSTSLVLEWPTPLSPRRHRLRALAAQLAVGLPADVLFVRSSPASPNRDIAPRSILAPIRGGSSARVVAATATALADAYRCALTVMHVQSATQHPDRSRREQQAFTQIVEEIRRPMTTVRQLRGQSPAASILNQAASHDLVIMGSWLNPQQPNVLVGRGLMRTVRQLPCPVIVVRAKNAAWVSPLSKAAHDGTDR